MNARPRTGLILTGLSLALVAQLAFAAYHFGRPAITPVERLAVGDVIAELATRDVSGDPVQLASNSAERTLLMIFNSECAHCRRAAPAWREWLSDPPAGVRILAVSNEPSDVAEGYAREMGWDVRVATVTVGERGDVAHSLTSRTPWLFLLDADGSITFQAHGEQLALLDGVLGREAAHLTEEE